MVKSLFEKSSHAIVSGESITFYPQKITLDCTLALEIEVYNSVLLRLSGKVCPTLEDVETERAIYQVCGGVLYSLCAEFDR